VVALSRAHSLDYVMRREELRHDKRLRRAIIRNVAGALGTDHPAVLLYALTLRAVTAASNRSALAGVMHELTVETSRLVDSTEARRYLEQARDHHRESVEAADEVARLSSSAELLESALVSRRDNATAERHALASKGLEELRARVSLSVHVLEDFAPPSSRPRTRATFAHAPPSFFVTETEAPGRGVRTIHSTNQVRSQEPSF